MRHVKTLIVGAGATGLAIASRLVERGDQDYLVIEADKEVGGYCKSVVQDGFTWDYSGHFFHFQHPHIEERLKRHIACPVITVQKKSYVDFKGRWIDFPFQKNIHQLDKADFIDCLLGLYDAEKAAQVSAAKGMYFNFLDMLYERFGAGIVDRFLKPYNQKLYACDLRTLDVNAMGRFFPSSTFHQAMQNIRRPDNSSYNSTFTYPQGGAIEYIRSLAHGVDNVNLDERLMLVDTGRKVAITSKEEYSYDRLVSSVPLPHLLRMTGLEHDTSAFSWNKVAVFNLGFDRKRQTNVHWAYYPDPKLCFYRVGWYDNIFNTDRLSLYVEVALDRDEDFKKPSWYLHHRVLPDLRSADVIGNQQLVSWHSVVMDPAYVHITPRGIEETKKARLTLELNSIHSIGRYGGWTYCSIEDNIVEAFALVDRWQDT